MAQTTESYNVLLISEVELKDYTFLNGNVDAAIIRPLILLSQDIYLTKVIGSTMKIALQDRKIANTLTTLDKTLLDNYIKPFLAWSIMKEAPVALSMKFMNKGMMKQNSVNSEPASLDEIQMMFDKSGDKADWYAQRLIDYLIANETDYPDYNSSSAKVDDVVPTVNGYRSRLYLRGDDRCGRYNRRKYD